MPLSTRMSRLILAAIALTLPLCPCGAANAGLPGGGETPIEIGAPAANETPSNIAGAHKHHDGNHGSAQTPSEPLPCHGPETPTDCGMADSGDAVSRGATPISSLELPAPITTNGEPFPTLHVATARAIHPPPSNSQPPDSTPVLRRERLLI